MDTKEALRWIAEVFEEPAGRITPETLRRDILGWDSLGSLSLIAAFDERLDIRLTEADIVAMKRIGDLLDFMRRNGKLEPVQSEAGC